MHNSSCCEEKDMTCCNEKDKSCCGEGKTSGDMVVDVVCGMELDPKETKLHLEHKGEVYYFCNMSCKNHFANDPKKYVGIIN